MSYFDMIDIRLHNLDNGLCFNIDSPAEKSLAEITQFLRQNMGITDSDLRYFDQDK